MGKFVRLEVDEDAAVATMHLGRPPMNALNTQLWREIGEVAVEAEEREDVRAVVLWGAQDLRRRGGYRATRFAQFAGLPAAREASAGELHRRRRAIQDHNRCNQRSCSRGWLRTCARRRPPVRGRGRHTWATRDTPWDHPRSGRVASRGWCNNDTGRGSCLGC